MSEELDDLKNTLLLAERAQYSSEVISSILTLFSQLIGYLEKQEVEKECSYREYDGD